MINRKFKHLIIACFVAFVVLMNFSQAGAEELAQQQGVVVYLPAEGKRKPGIGGHAAQLGAYRVAVAGPQ